ncbi:MAG: FkbM family methyltransferase [Mesorhizobium sp.]|nr:FkbM family methyltransferase [Mesorhizobium sp.]
MTSTQFPFGEVDKRFIAKLVETGFTPKVIYDIGASNGSWTWTVSKLMKGAEFHLFEPQLASQPAWAETIGNVQKYTPNTTLHPVALGERNGTAKLQLFASQAAASMLRPGLIDNLKSRLMGKGRSDELEVPMHRLDDYARKNDLPPPDIIKMDVQGYELEILKGGEEALKAASVVLAECWIERSYGGKTPLLHEVIDYFFKRGFVLLDLGETFLTDRRAISAVDAYFMRQDVANTLFAGAGGVLNWRS